MSVSRLVSFEEGAAMLQLHHTTVRQRKAGTEMLTHVNGLGRRKFLVRAEVEALVAKTINQSVEQDKERKSLLRVA
jgi:hypothetical protein